MEGVKIYIYIYFLHYKDTTEIHNILCIKILLILILKKYIYFIMKDID